MARNIEKRVESQAFMMLASIVKSSKLHSGATNVEHKSISPLILNCPRTPLTIITPGQNTATIIWGEIKQISPLKSYLLKKITLGY